jgi:UDP-glucose 4-epimerase
MPSFISRARSSCRNRWPTRSDYYLNNTVKSRALLESAVRCGVRHFVFSSTAAVYGTPEAVPVAEDAPTHPESPYGTSKLMTEWMLRDTAAAHDFRYAALRYFNVAGADPRMRTGQSTKGATHLIKIACETATGKRPYMEIYGTDYPTPDGTCIRDYIHVWISSRCIISRCSDCVSAAPVLSLIAATATGIHARGDRNR